MAQIRLNGDMRLKLLLNAPSVVLTDWEQGYLAALSTPEDHDRMKGVLYQKVAHLFEVDGAPLNSVEMPAET